jgi:hypothetical protein
MLINESSFIWPVEFGCTLVIEKLILPNFYNIRLSVEPTETGDCNITAGFQKIRYFVDHCLHNSIFISSENEFTQPFMNAETNLVVFPVEPYDYFVGSVLYQKFISISKKYFDITQITIDSLVGDKIQYNIQYPEESGLELQGEYWWNEDRAATGGKESGSWGTLDLDDQPSFQPKIIRGGLSDS